MSPTKFDIILFSLFILFKLTFEIGEEQNEIWKTDSTLSEATIKTGSMDHEILTKNGIKFKLSLDQSGKFIETVRKIDKSTKNLQEFRAYLRGKLLEIWELVWPLLEEVELAVAELGLQILYKIMNATEEQNQEMSEAEIEAKVEEAKVALIRWKLYSLSAQIIEQNMLGYVCGKEVKLKLKFFKWWRRFRYQEQIDSRVTRNVDGISINEIRMSIYQYYTIRKNEFSEFRAKIELENDLFSDQIAKLAERKSKFAIFLFASKMEQKKFDPETELPRGEKLELMETPEANEVPIFVLKERFPIPLKFGYLSQAMGVEHKAVKVYDIEFHFHCANGIFLYDKARYRSDDPDRGIEFAKVHYTTKSQWEVQEIFDSFYGFHEENGHLMEGKFGCAKYHILENNCAHFTRAFIDALLEGDPILKSNKWPPKILKQSFWTKDPFKRIATALVKGFNASVIKRDNSKL